MKLPPLTALHYFTVAAEHLSFVKAANELHVTEGAVSRQMKLLAQYYEKPLFIKKGRGIELTENGDILLQTALPALQNISQVSDSLLAEDNELRINVTTSFAIRWLLPKLNDFECRFPQYIVRMQASTSAASIADKAFDLRINYFLKPEIVAPKKQRKLLDEWLLAVCSPSYLSLLNKSGKPIELSKIHTAKLILNEMTGRDWRLWAEKLGLGKLAIESALKFEQDDVAIQAAVAGHGIALANVAYVKRELSLGSLVPATRQTAMVVGAHYIQIDNSAINNNAVQAFAHWLQEMTLF
jgi:LysR family glycine cleavage system transcriptional activator